MRPRAAKDGLDHTLYFPALGSERHALAYTLAKVASDPNVGRFLDYQSNTRLPDHRAAESSWLEHRGVAVDPERMIVTAGAQHGIIVSLAALTRPGDKIPTERLTYQGI